MSTTLLGIDISSYQRPADCAWPTIKAGGVAFAFIKATEGTVPDTAFAAHWAGAGGVGLPRGPYHFFHPAFDPVLQAQAFANAVQADPGELPPMVDLEDQDNVNNDVRIRAVTTFLAEVQQRLGRKPILYTSQYWWQGHMRAGDGSFPNWAQNFALWVAEYPYAHDNDKLNPRPALPDLNTIRGFTGQLMPPGWQDWAIWQFTGHGSVAGVTGDVDEDLFCGTLADLQALLNQPVHIPNGGGGPQPAQPQPAFAGFTNQDVINVFYLAAQALTAAGTAIKGWDLVTKAGLTYLGVPATNRTQHYTGPAIAGMSALSQAERDALANALQAYVPNPAPQNGHLSWEHHALAGLHGPAEPGWGWVQPAFDAVQQSKVHAVKVLTPDVQTTELGQLQSINGGLFIVARLFNAQLNKPQGGGTPEAAAQWFVNQVADPTDSNSPMQRAYNAGVHYFEVGNEPNLLAEGLGANWADGAEFGRFFQKVVALLKPRYPDALFGFPGMSPGAAMAGVRPITAEDFWMQAQAAVAQADFVGCHIYWGQLGVSLDDAVAQLQLVCDRFAHQRVLCTEFSNNDPTVSHPAKAAQYDQFYQKCQGLPANLGAMFAFALSRHPDPNGESFLAWNTGTRSWDGTPMAGQVGAQMPRPPA